MLYISSYNSVCYNQMFICIECLWTLNGLLAVQLLENPLWLFCIHCVPRLHVQELEKSRWLFLQYILELSWVFLGWGLEISLHPLRLGHPFLLMPNFLPNTGFQFLICKEKVLDSIIKVLQGPFAAVLAPEQTTWATKYYKETIKDWK